MLELDKCPNFQSTPLVNLANLIFVFSRQQRIIIGLVAPPTHSRAVTGGERTTHKCKLHEHNSTREAGQSVLFSFAFGETVSGLESFCVAFGEGSDGSDGSDHVESFRGEESSVSCQWAST